VTVKENLCRLELFTTERNKTNLNTLVECLGNALEQVERVAVIVCIFQAADGRSTGADVLGKFLLRKTGLGSKIIDLPGNYGVDHFLFVLLRLVSYLTTWFGFQCLNFKGKFDGYVSISMGQSSRAIPGLKS
jgi:hypothetical protein